jgi:flagellar basal-body rod protein FlgC
MSLSFSSSVSGVQAAFAMLNVSAHNTANLNTDGFKKQVVNPSEDSTGGVVADISQSTEAGPLYRNSNGDIVEASNVNYFEEAVEQIKAKHLLSANIAAIHRTDEAFDSLMDIMA